MELVDIQVIMERLAIPTKGAALKYLTRLGVQPYHLGRGRSLGNRWDYEEVLAAMKVQRDGAPRKPRAPHGGQQTAQAMAYFGVARKS